MDAHLTGRRDGSQDSRARQEDGGLTNCETDAQRRRQDMLKLRPNCECCNRDLPADSAEAFICSFECTFCRSCAREVLGGVCPNCGGELVARPRRPADK